MPDEQPELGPKYISATALAKLGDVSEGTMARLIQGGTLVPAKQGKKGVPLFDPDAPEVVAWLRAVRGKWPPD